MTTEEDIIQSTWEEAEKKKLQKAINDFSVAMKNKLEDNLHKSGWDDMTCYDIYDCLRIELEELHLAINKNITEKRDAEIADEAIDIANFAMFLWFWATSEVGT